MRKLDKYIKLLQRGEVVAFPTETVYGLGADAWNPAAIKKIFEYKGRPADNPLIVHIYSIEQVSDFADEISETAQKLMHEFWPGPLTLVFKKKASVLDLITSGLTTVAVRIPGHEIALELISKAGPMVAPSANKSGRPSPTKADHVREDFGADFPVIDGGSTQVGLESTVLDVSGNTPVILRPGKIGKNELEAFLGIEVKLADFENVTTPKSPGQKYSHYKPKADVMYGEISSIQDEFLYLLQAKNKHTAANIINYNGNLHLLSRELYDRFRQADLEGYKTVIIEEIEPFQKEFPSLYSALKNRIDKTISNH